MTFCRVYLVAALYYQFMVGRFVYRFCSLQWQETLLRGKFRVGALNSV